MTAKKDRSGLGSDKPPRQRRPDEDDHPVEGYRDASVYEEPGENAPPAQARPRNRHDSLGPNGDGRGGELQKKE